MKLFTKLNNNNKLFNKLNNGNKLFGKIGNTSNGVRNPFHNEQKEKHNNLELRHK